MVSSRQERGRRPGRSVWTIGASLAVLSSLVHLAGADAGSAASIAATQSGDESLFTKIGNFASDNATWFIIGLIALAVILAAFFIIRAGRKGKTADGSPTGKAKVSPAQPRTTAGAAATSAAANQPTAQPSAAEMKRRRRAAMQRAREEERLRRQGVRRAGKQPSAQMDPVEAEKAAARGQTPVAPAGSEAGQPPVPPPAGEAPTAVTPPAPSAAAGAVAAGAAAGAMAGRVESADAEERLREKVEQIKAGQTGAPVPSSAEALPVTPSGGEASAVTASGGDQGGAGLGEVAPDLADAERRLQAERATREQTLGDAEVRLRELEARAEAAERRAAFAEQLANLRAEEGEQERRLNEVLARIERAEHRAQMAEIRAEEAERTASEALRGGSAPAPQATPQPRPPAPAPQVAPTPSPAGIPTPPPAAQGGPININTAGFEELRSAELSVTQATRVMAYRERFGGYGSIEDLGRVPGFTPDVVEALRGRLTT